MGEFLRRISRSLKESSQDWPQIAANYEQTKRADSLQRAGLARQTSRDAMYDQYRRHGQILQEFQLQIAPLTHQLELIGQQVEKAIDLGDVDILAELNKRQEELQAEMNGMIQKTFHAVGQGSPEMPSEDPQAAPTVRPSSMPVPDQVKGSNALEAPLTGMPSALDQSPLAPLRRIPADQMTQNLPAIRDSSQPPVNPKDVIQNLPAITDPSQPPLDPKEALQPLGAAPEDNSISMRLARGARNKKEEQYLRQALTGARTVAAKEGAQAGMDYLEMAIGHPLTDQQKSFYRPRLHEVASVQNDVEGIYRYMLKAKPEDRRSIWMGIPVKTRSELLVQHPDLEIPTVDAATRRQGNQLGSVDVLVNKTFDYLNNPKFTDKMGPIYGNVYGLNPKDEDVQDFKSHIMLSAQIIGKYLEGGKMTDMDALRYMAMLPKFTDTPGVARRKMENIRGLVAATKKIYLANPAYDREGNNELDLPFNPNNAPLSDLADWINENGDSDPNASEIMQIYESRKELEDMAAEEEDAVMQESE